MYFNTNISIIIRTRNSGKYLKRNLESISCQNCKVSEIIIIDSGSQDNTFNIANEFNCKIIKYPIEDINFNYSKALNIGIEQAKTDYIFIISSHVWLPNNNTIKWMLDKLNEDSNLKAVSLSRSNKEIHLNADIRIPFGKNITKTNFSGEGMYNYCSLIRKSDWETYKFREDIPTCEDQEWIWHWMKTQNASSFIFKFPLAGYDNPNYNLAKDVQEFYTLGKYVYPRYSRFIFIWELFIKALKFLRQKRVGKAKHYFKLATKLLKYKFFPPKSIQSDNYLKQKN